VTALGNTHPALQWAWHPVARLSDLGDEPLGVELLGQPWVVYQVPDAPPGEVRVWRDRCPHRLAPLSLGTLEPAGLRCGYHGWCFDRAGQAVDVPALGPGATIPSRVQLQPPARVAVSHGMVWVAPQAPLTPLPHFPENLDGLDVIDLPVFETRAGAGLLADNFLDIAHFPFVHAGTFGADESREVQPFEVERDGWGFRVSYTHSFANREDPGVAAGLRPLVQQRRMTYLYRAPFALMLRLDFLDSGGVNIIGFFLQPVDAQRCRIYSTLWRNDVGGDPDRAKLVADFEVAVIEEDLRIQSSYRDLALPLDRTAELHTRADRSTLELRRILADLVEATGATE